MTTKDFLEIYDNSTECFDEDTLIELWCEGLEGNYTEETEVEYGEPDRWNHSETKIVRVEDRFFELGRWAGNTEYQPDEYNWQPEEVRPIEEIVKIVRWERVD